MAYRVVPHVALDLVHRLPNADEGAEVDDTVDAVECRVDDRCIGEVSVHEAHPLRQRDLLETLVHLCLEAVEDNDVVPAQEELAHEMRADEPGSSGNQRLHLHTTSGRTGGRQLAT